jgi:hypothetical protein
MPLRTATPDKHWEAEYAEHGSGQFDSLVLVAPPGVLAELKQKLSKPMAELLGRRPAKRPDQSAGSRPYRAPRAGALALFFGLWASFASRSFVKLTALSLDGEQKGRILL